MNSLHITLLTSILNVSFFGPTLEYPSTSTKISQSSNDKTTTTNDVEAGASNIILQSNDGGRTWQDISQSLPANENPEDFFAGDSDLYLRVNNVMYHSNSNLKTPVWEKENGLDPRAGWIAFNPSGTIAYNYSGQIYKKVSPSGTWMPVYSNFTKNSMRSVFETSDGIVFLGYDHGLYKSVDKGKSWKQVQNEGWVMDIVESDGVLVGTGQRGIMRSTDHGETWEWVIREGGVGIAIERIKGGFAAISYNTTIKSRRIHISFDSGKTWKAIDDGFPPSLSISSIKEVGGYLICGHPDGIFRSSDMGKTWNIVHPGVNKDVFKFTMNAVDSNTDTKVFKIYVSGNFLYAVAVNAGC